MMGKIKKSTIVFMAMLCMCSLFSMTAFAKTENPTLSLKKNEVNAGSSTTATIELGNNGSETISNSDGTSEGVVIKSVTWKTSDANIASIKEKSTGSRTATAKVTGKSAGKVKVTALVKLNDGSIYQLHKSITVTNADGTHASTGYSSDSAANPKSVTAYNSENGSTGTVYPEGTYDFNFGYVKYVANSSNATTVRISGAYVGSKAVFSLEHNAGEKITWSLSDTSVAKFINLSSNNGYDEGTIRFKQAGTVTLKGKSAKTGEVVAKKKITVKPYVQKIKVLEGTDQSMKVGTTLTLNYRVIDVKDRTHKTVPSQVGLTAESADKTIAKVKSCEDGELKIVGLKTGTTTITIKANDGSGVKKKINVKVKANGDILAVSKMKK